MISEPSVNLAMGKVLKPAGVKCSKLEFFLLYQFVSNWPKSLFRGDAFNVQGDKVPDVFLQRNVESLLFNLRESAKVADDFVRPANQVAAQTDVVDCVHGQVLNEQDPFALWVADVLPVIIFATLQSILEIN